MGWVSPHATKLTLDVFAPASSYTRYAELNILPMEEEVLTHWFLNSSLGYVTTSVGFAKMQIAGLTPRF